MKKSTNFALRIAADKADKAYHALGSMFDSIQERGLWEYTPDGEEATKERYRDAEEMLEEISRFFRCIHSGMTKEELMQEMEDELSNLMS